MKILLIGSQGYVGSYLWKRFHEDDYNLYGVDVERPLKSNNSFQQNSYQDLDVDFLSKFTIVLFFAGVSSVKQANINPMYTIEQNTLDMVKFSQRCADANTRLIYASSGSVYADNTGNLLFTASETTLNSYDASKLAFDLIANYSNPLSLGLRMGTISGWSSKLRPELIFNSMCISAIKNKKILISNPQNYRSILFLDDLYEIIKRLLNEDNVCGNIPCSSYTGSIGQIASTIANYFNVNIEMQDGSSTYSFALKKSPYDTLVPPSIEKECEIFHQQWKVENEK